MAGFFFTPDKTAKESQSTIFNLFKLDIFIPPKGASLF